tara:strand:+ start:297 stop:779 length:483 start_codon:yes stop_codon:yes gene_type:complete
MADFSGKIVEAYFLNPESTVIEIIYTADDLKNRSYCIEVDPNHSDFNDLMSEYSLERVEKTTIAKHKERREEMRKVSKIMAKEYVIELKEKHKKEIKELKYFGWMDILKYIRNDDEDELFKLKMNLFKSDIVKETTNSESLDKIRNAKTFIEVLEEYKKL